MDTNEAKKRDFLRAWFASIRTKEELDEALCFVKGFLEEVVLAHKQALLEVHIEKKLNTS